MLNLRVQSKTSFSGKEIWHKNVQVFLLLAKLWQQNKISTRTIYRDKVHNSGPHYSYSIFMFSNALKNAPQKSTQLCL